MKKRIIAALVAACFINISAQAETSGHGSRFDSRIQSVMYNPDNVYRVQTMPDRGTTIEFEPGETINLDSGALVLGNPGSQAEPEWIIGANKAGTAVFLKPSRYAKNPETNAIIRTNKRTYLFDLRLAQNVRTMTYLLRFQYPQPPKTGESPFTGRTINSNPCPGSANWRYQKRGDMALSPYSVWDNGTFTCFRFPTNAPRPAIYTLLPDGREALVNSHLVNDIVVVHGVSQGYRLRLNTLVLGVRTTTSNTGWYNYNGTTTGEIREVKKDDVQ